MAECRGNENGVYRVYVCAGARVGRPTPVDAIETKDGPPTKQLTPSRYISGIREGCSRVGVGSDVRRTAKAI